jgi:hypothetical protein
MRIVFEGFAIPQPSVAKSWLYSLTGSLKKNPAEKIKIRSLVKKRLCQRMLGLNPVLGAFLASQYMKTRPKWLLKK